MKKNDLAKVVAEKNNITHMAGKAIVSAFFDSLSAAMEEGMRTELRGFGIFEIKEYEGYLGRNPQNGEAVSVPPKRAPRFKMSKKNDRTSEDV
jgi:integration host factor subunit beta